MVRTLPTRPWPPSGPHISHRGLGGRGVLSTHRLHGEDPALCRCRGNRTTNPLRAGAQHALESDERCQRVPVSPVPS